MKTNGSLCEGHRLDLTAKMLLLALLMVATTAILPTTLILVTMFVALLKRKQLSALHDHSSVLIILAAAAGLVLRSHHQLLFKAVLRGSAMSVLVNGNPYAIIEELSPLQVLGTPCPESGLVESVQEQAALAMAQMLHGKPYAQQLAGAIKGVRDQRSFNQSIMWCGNVAALRTVSRLDSCPGLSTFLGNQTANQCLLIKKAQVTSPGSRRCFLRWNNNAALRITPPVSACETRSSLCLNFRSITPSTGWLKMLGQARARAFT